MSIMMRCFLWVCMFGLTVLSGLPCHGATNVEERVDKLRVSFEQVAKVFGGPKDVAATQAMQWIETGALPSAFECDATMLFLRRIGDIVVDDQRARACSRLEAIMFDEFPGFQNRWHRALMPCETLKRIAVIRMRAPAVTNAVDELLGLEADIAGSRCRTGFLCNEIVHLMLEAGLEVPERLRKYPEYVRHEVVQSSRTLTNKEIFEKAIESTQSVIGRKKRTLAAGETRSGNLRNVFVMVAYQCLVLEQSGDLAEEAKMFVESTSSRKPTEVDMPLLTRIVWSYVVAARHIPRAEADALLRKVEVVIGEGATRSWLGVFGPAVESDADSWWLRAGLFSLGRLSFLEALYAMER